MARSQVNIQPYVSFVRGLITEASELTYPENASQDELNCILEKKGNRTRRLGIDFETGYSESTQDFTTAEITENAMASGVWKAVAGDGNLNFVVVQVGNTLLFYDAGSVPLSSGLKSFTVDLSTYTASGATQPELVQVEMASGKGYLFITSERIDPIYITHDPDLDTITVTECNIEIRDFDGVDDGLEIDETPVTLSTLHNYNLNNQGWYIDDVRLDGPSIGDPLTKFFNSEGEYPSNSYVWWLMKDLQAQFNPEWRETLPRGTTEAPKGHYILNPFYKDRNAASGLSGIAVESIASRPTAVAFFAGRVWYAGQKGADINDNIFYSQIIEAPQNIGRCYQENDPTAEDLSDVLATDGGVIIISDIGNVLKMVPVGDSLVLFCTNGVWSIGGTDGGFTATDISIRKITSTSAINPKAIVEVEGTPVWWSSHGIYSLQESDVSGFLQAVSLTDNTIKTFYEDIPLLSKLYAQGAFDPVTRKIQWVYSSTTPTDEQNRFVYDRVLNFDFDLQAFYPWSIEGLAADTPVVTSIVTFPALSSTTSTFNVIDGLGQQVIDASLNDVVADANVLSSVEGGIKFLTVVVDGSFFEVTFSEFNNEGNLDWETEDSTGVEYSSYLVTGYELFGDIARFKQAPYVYTYLKDNDDFDNHSLYLQGRWDFSNAGNSGKWTSKFQTYRDIGNTNTEVLVTRHKFRGKGRALQFYYESDGVNKFNILGWAITAQGNTEV